MTSEETELPTTRRLSTATFAWSGIVLSAITIFAGNYDVQPGENGGVGPAIITGVGCAVVAAVLFLLVVPRVRDADRAALVLGILTVLSIAIFWSGLTPILGAATLAVAAKSPVQLRRTTVFRWLAIAATALTTIGTLVQSHLF
jgi:hypothetical protein